jgi:hypothetical protein
MSIMVEGNKFEVLVGIADSIRSDNSEHVRRLSLDNID